MYKADEQRYDHCEPRPAGNSGLVLPPVSLGLWHHFSSADPYADRRDLILNAFDRGVFHFDVANHYGDNEEAPVKLCSARYLAATCVPTVTN